MLIEGAVDRQLHGDGLEEVTDLPSHVSELRWRGGKQAPSDERFPLGALRPSHIRRSTIPDNTATLDIPFRYGNLVRK
jgi:hypothetical protein